MSDKPRDWPYKAANVRDEAAELLQSIIKELEPVVLEDRIFTERERILRETRSLHNAAKALRLLEGVGAKTRP